MQKNTNITKPWNKSEGVHPGMNGKFIVSVPSKSKRSANKFEALSQHDTEELANQVFADYKKNNLQN
jgi:hypothetical protein